jgi:AcrR family transcriptional regulator
MSDSTTEKILDAAVDLFISAGFAETSMDAIAAKAGVAKGTLYYHYKSKEGIVDALVEAYARRVEAAFESILAEDIDVPKKQSRMIQSLSRINGETFSQLHKMRYIDINQKTAAISISRFCPYFVRLIEEGELAGLCQAEHAREFVEIFLAAAQFLLDPEYGTERFAARSAALGLLAERAFGLKAGSIDLS